MLEFTRRTPKQYTDSEIQKLLEEANIDPPIYEYKVFFYNDVFNDEIKLESPMGMWGPTDYVFKCEKIKNADKILSNVTCVEPVDLIELAQELKDNKLI